MNKDNICFWISDFFTLNGKYNGEDDYWVGEKNDNNQNRLTEFLSSVINVEELKANDIIVINFNTKKLGYERHLQDDTSSYSFVFDHIRYNLLLDEDSQDNKVVVEKWYLLTPLLDKKN